MNFIFIDPGTRYSAYSAFKDVRLVNSKSSIQEIYLWRYGLIRVPPASSKLQWHHRARDISLIFAQMLKQLEPILFGIEFPEYQSGERGYNAARGGSTLKLAYLCGSLCSIWDMYATAIIRHKKVYPPLLIYPAQWKGQLPKKITRMRVNEAFGLQLKEGIEENISDAIGIGQWTIEKQKMLQINYKLREPTERKDF